MRGVRIETFRFEKKTLSLTAPPSRRKGRNTTSGTATIAPAALWRSENSGSTTNDLASPFGPFINFRFFAPAKAFSWIDNFRLFVCLACALSVAQCLSSL
jgi:hypothetical protein